MRVGAIDIGTNTFLCLIADVDAGRVERVVADHVEIVRLGEGVHKSRLFSDAALQRADECLGRFRQMLTQHKVERIKAVATSAARDVHNSERLLELGKKYSIPIEVINGEREAELTFDGVLTNPIFGDEIAVIDVGGGSTEITRRKINGEIVGQSLDMGGVRLTEIFVTGHPTPQEDIKSLRAFAQEKLKELSIFRSGPVVAVAGTPTTIAALELKTEYDRESIEGFKLSVATIEKWIQTLAKMDVSSRSLLKGLEPKRADIIVAGAVILSECIKKLGADSVFVSTRGVRFGVARELGMK